MVNHVVTIVGVPSYTSGAQLWNGAAATLNKNPILVITSPIITGPSPSLKLFTLSTESNEKILSRSVNPV
jgi:hypothetical protein